MEGFGTTKVVTVFSKGKHDLKKFELRVFCPRFFLLETFLEAMEKNLSLDNQCTMVQNQVVFSQNLLMVR